VSFNTDIDPGRGITARMNDAGVGSSLLLSDALIERSVDSAVTLAASDGALARVVLRDIAPRPSGLFGYGLSLLASLDGATVSSATWQAGLIERTHTLGVLVSGASLSADGLLIRDIAEEALSGYFGRGITAQMLAFNETTDLTLRWSRIDRVRDAGVAVFNTHAWIEGVAIDTVGATLVDNTFGDGIDIFGGDPQSFATVRSSAVSNAARAGIANFASAVTVGSNTLRCNGVDLNGEDGMLHDYAFIDEGGNVCGCPDQAPCKVFSSMLTPPTAPMPPTP
jgi:hypothetical protein